MSIKTFQELEDEWKENNPLRKFRKNRHLKQSTIAASMEVSYHVVYRWESGMTEPTKEQFQILGKLTGIKKLADEWKVWMEQRPIFEKGE